MLRPHTQNPTPGGARLTLTTAAMPAYNEEISIVLRTRQHTDRMLVIDDGSTDRTAEVAELAGAEIIRHHQNMGKGAALKTGFGAVNGADIVVTLDTDASTTLPRYPS